MGVISPEMTQHHRCLMRRSESVLPSSTWCKECSREEAKNEWVTDTVRVGYQLECSYHHLTSTLSCVSNQTFWHQTRYFCWWYFPLLSTWQSLPIQNPLLGWSKVLVAHCSICKPIVTFSSLPTFSIVSSFSLDLIFVDVLKSNHENIIPGINTFRSRENWYSTRSEDKLENIRKGDIVENKPFV